jgi:glycosyltransferase involved in cell wall biosynthesis
MANSRGMKPQPCVALMIGSYRPEQSGVADYTAHLRHALENYGLEVPVLTDVATARAAGDPRVLAASPDWRIRDLPAMVRAIRASHADLLHIQHAADAFRYQRAIFLLPLFLRSTGWRKPIVTTLHEYGWWEWQPRFVPAPLLEGLKQWGQRRGWWDREDGFLLTGSRAVIVTNQEAEAVVVGRLPQLADRTYRIPIAANIEVVPVERDEARRNLRRAMGWPDDSLVVAFFGFIHAVKGLEYLLRAFAEVREREPRACLVMIGGVKSLALRGHHATEYWDSLVNLIGELGLQDAARMTGYVDADTASRYLGGADIGVLPFTHGLTPKSGSLLAVLAHGLPTIGTLGDGAPSELADGRLLRTAPPRDAGALARAIIELLHTPTVWPAMRQAGLDYISRRNWPAIADEHLAIYRRLLDRAT